MTHKGNKSDYTKLLEELFVGIMRAHGAEVHYEVQCGTGVIDFVVGDGDGTDEHRMYYEGMTGVELKSTMNDFRTWNGLNVNAYPYTYILVPEKIAYSAMKRLERFEELRHVGLIVIMDDCTIDMYKHAAFNPNVRTGKMVKHIEEDGFDDYQDSVAYYLNGSDYVPFHNYETGETWYETISVDFKRTKIQPKDKSEEKSA